MWLFILFLWAGILAAPVGAEAICLRVESGSRSLVTIPAAVGDEVRLGFRHSIYDSHMEEHFRIAGEGLQLVRLRYSEGRLVEFYGHEAARREGDWWIVEGTRRAIPALIIRANPDSRVEITLNQERMELWRLLEPGGLIRLTVKACEGE